MKESQEKEVDRGRDVWYSRMPVLLLVPTLVPVPGGASSQKKRNFLVVLKRIPFISDSRTLTLLNIRAHRPCCVSCPVPGSPMVGQKAGSIRTWLREDDRVLFWVFPILVGWVFGVFPSGGGSGRGMELLVAGCSDSSNVDMGSFRRYFRCVLFYLCRYE